MDIPIYYYALSVIIGAAVWFWRKSWSSGLLAAYLFFILTETVLIRKIGVTTGFRPELFWSWKVPGLRSEIYANILLFIPVGILLGVKRGWKGIPIATGISLIIELIQLVSRRGLFEFDDILHNTIGVVMGFGIVCLYRKVKRNVV